MSNEDLRKSWDRMVGQAPCMALIEDIDRVFDGDRNIAPQTGMLSSGGLTFNALLNAIDGIERHDGVLLIVTTNHIDKVDPALRNRKGRIDRVVHFDALDHAGRVTLARRITGDHGLAERLATEHEGAQTSTFVEACCTAARRARYETRVELGPMRTVP
jgi:SpoVK/Ycf46/Vps4 family AAA+-type ATPase